jgi:diguanylate cyclase (GGDEF)-like protein/PAS domain S-box-containing protein
MRDKSGRQIPALLSATVVELEGEPCVLCIVKDVSELRKAQSRLQASEQRFRGAFENAPIGIILLDTRGYIFEANRFASDLLDYDPDALNGVHISRLLPAEDRGDLKSQLESLVRGREVTSYTERRMVCASGLEIWTNCHIVLQRGADDEPSYCIMQIADVTEVKHNQRRMERLAFFDTLTELANRRLFNDRLSHAIEHALRSQRRAALLYLDLDQFKRVNDTLGHDAGDELLQEVSRRLLRCVRKEDTVGRPGGDEFTILLYDVSSPTDAGHVAEKILTALREPVIISGHQLVVTTSIGIATIPDDGVDANALLKNADLAMYRAKEQGRNNFQFYSEELNANAEKRLRTEYELRRALERGEFELFYQPKMRLADQALVGVESLLRWRHPDRGLVTPDGFISIAEETGDIVEIGSWVIQEACAAGSRMVEQQGRLLSIGVNISPRQFRDPNLVATVRQALRQAQLPPACLELEITETMLMHDVEAASETLHRLHELGVKLAIDDFGTGYSSLNYLKKFPIDTVKVDRSFIMDIPDSADDKAISAAVIAMAHRLNMAVVAEGVETAAQLEFLLANDCDYGQGYLFGRPVPLGELRPLLAPKGPRASSARNVQSMKARLNHGT